MDNILELKTTHSRILDEAIEKVAVKMRSQNQRDRSKVFMITGPGANAGSSTVALNIAVSLTRSGAKTVFMDCDFRRAAKDKIFSCDPDNTFTDYILGDIAEYKAVLKKTSIEGLECLIAGEKKDNPIKYLSSPLMAHLIKELREEYDFVIIDMPPVGIYNDAELLMPYIDKYIFVVAANMTTKKELFNSRVQLANYEDKYAGIVINKINRKQYEKNTRDYESLASERSDKQAGKKDEKKKGSL